MRLISYIDRNVKGINAFRLTLGFVFLKRRRYRAQCLLRYCGTTVAVAVAVAQRLGRCWIGSDITYQSISLILKRLADKYPADWP